MSINWKQSVKKPLARVYFKSLYLRAYTENTEENVNINEWLGGIFFYLNDLD